MNLQRQSCTRNTFVRVSIKSTKAEIAKLANGDPSRITPRINIVKMTNKRDMQSFIELILKLVENLPEINKESKNDVLPKYNASA